MDVFRQPSHGEQYHKLIRSLREKAPVIEVNYDNQKIILVTGYEALREAFLDSDQFPPHAMYGFNTEPYVGKTVMSAPEPDHAILRKLSMPAFKLNTVANYSENLVESLCQELIEDFTEQPDLIRDFALRLPTLVIIRMLGLPREAENLFQEWSLDILYRTSLENAKLWGAKLGDYLRPFVAMRRQYPENDVITQLVQAEVNGRKLTDDEIISHIRLLMPVGADPVHQALSNTLYALLLHDGLWETLQDNQDLIPAAMEESFRWEAPIAILPRLSGPRGFKYYGCEVKPFQPTFFCISGAHRDPSVFENPDSFDLSRRMTAPLLTFGPGHKHCPGIHLAKIEIRIALRVLLQHIHNPRRIRYEPSSAFLFRAARTLELSYDRG